MKRLIQLFPVLLLAFSAQTWAVSVSQTPLFLTGGLEPRIMLLLSRDHELSKKAYTDYTDLDGNGTLDTSYNDAIDYYGYFNANRCYSYSTSNNRFEPSTAATGTYSHECSGAWSGNFLNWATMTRLDVVRKVLYGGFRSTDSTGTTLGTTVLERAFLPPDVHAFAKVYAPAGGATDVAKVTPYSETAVTLCSVTDMSAGAQAGTIDTVNGTSTASPPLIKVASGSWPQWAMTEILQCQWKEQTVEASPTRPSTVAGHRLTGSTDLVARVAVCAPGMLESNCKSYYTRDTTPVETVKPTGLLQEYGDVDSNKRSRFGLMTGSYKKNTSGGVLRKNVKLLTNNNAYVLNNSSICGDNHADDEVDVCTGQFINQSTGDQGIIDSLNRIHIAGYKSPSAGSISSSWVCAGGYNNSDPFACSASSLLSGTNGTCIDWGNPLSEMYHEALRYFAGKTSATSAYSDMSAEDSDATAVITGLGNATWNSASDPLPSTQWCALSNIIVLSTGLSSLDNSTITSDITGLDPAALTNAVGTAEGISGSYLIGSNGVTSDNLCSAKTISNLSTASGICPEVPHMRGGYLIAGLASSNQSLDLRPGYAADRATRWTGTNTDWVERQPLSTYAVSLAENLPSFEIAVGSGTVTLVPACRSGGSSICSMTDLRVENHSATAGSFLVSWEDNSAGSDYDMDIIQRLEYCVGAACSPAVAAGQIQITVSAVQAATGASMELGYTVVGTSADGTVFPIKIPGTATCDPTACASGSANQRFFSLLTSPPAYRCTDYVTSTPDASYTCPSTSIRMPSGLVSATGCPSCPTGVTCTGWGANCGCPKVGVYTQSGSPSSALLKNPLWYAAKYSAPTDSWDLKNNNTGAAGADGEPDNFFDVRNPAQLHTRLANVIDLAATTDASAAAIATNSTRLDNGTSVYQAKFNSLEWSGQLLAFGLDSNGDIISTPIWDTDNSGTFATPGARAIYTSNPSCSALGSCGLELLWASLTAGQQAYLNTSPTGVVDSNGANRLLWLRGQAVSGMRTRTKPLGDIVNADPVYVHAQNFGYIRLGGTLTTTYSTYLSEKTNDASLHPPMLYVGANDGMLHAFDANTGVEKFAYMPNLLMPKLSKLTATDYTHQYYVDTAPGFGDAYIDTGDGLSARWRTILVGGLGAGGKGVYALDVTYPDSFGANKVLWEFTHSELGDLSGTPQVVRGPGGDWVAIFGNGYNSASGTGKLFIVKLNPDLSDGWTLNADYWIVDTNSTTGNGLGTPAIYDFDGTRTIGDNTSDAIYVPDLLGNVWKFKYQTGAWQSVYKSGSTPVPLFQATDGTSPQPITAPLEIGDSPNGSGVMIYFGTGQYFATGDTTSYAVQSLYGIWDNGAAIGTADSRNQLVEQTIDAEVDLSITEDGVTTTNTLRVTSSNAVTLKDTGSSSSHVYGWYMDLKDPPYPAGTAVGERVVSTPILRHGRAIFTTLIPSTNPCSFGGSSWLMEFDASNGGPMDEPVLDINNDGAITSEDVVTVAGVTRIPSGIKFETGIVKAPAVISAGTKEYKITSSTSAEIIVVTERGFDQNPRTSWREVYDE